MIKANKCNCIINIKFF